MLGKCLSLKKVFYKLLKKVFCKHLFTSPWLFPLANALWAAGTLDLPHLVIFPMS